MFKYKSDWPLNKLGNDVLGLCSKNYLGRDGMVVFGGWFEWMG